MKKSAVWKLVATAAGLALMDFLLCHLAGFKLYGGSLFAVLGGWILTLAMTGLFFVALWRLEQQEKRRSEPAQVSLIDVNAVRALARTVKKTDPKVFKKQMRDLDSQILRLEKKAEQLDQALRDYFEGSRISYSKFAAAVNGGIGVFQDNTRRILSRIDIFDVDGYETLFKKHLEYTDAIEPYQKSFALIDEDLAVNEQILQRLDRLQEEVRHLSNPQSDLDTLPAMQELSELIDQTRLYQQRQH